MTEEKRPRSGRGVRFARALASLNLIGLGVLWLLDATLADRNWLATVVCYLPAVMLSLPTLLLVPLLFVRDRATRAAVLLALPLALLRIGWCVGAAQEAPASAPRLRLLTWNIHHGGGTDFREAARIIARHDPDVFAVQECLGTCRRILAESLPAYTVHGDGDAAIGTRLPLVDAGGARYAGRTSRSLIHMTVSQGGRPVTILTTHLATPYHPGSLKRRGLRAEVSRAIAKRERQIAEIQSAIAKAPGAVVLCGDLNTPAVGRYFAALRGGLIDCYAATGAGLGWTFPTSFPIQRIDHVFAGKGAAPLRTQVLAETYSDHRPILAELVLR